ncbi:UTP--glucose-1-phosphate uridylyltransferase [Psidium guajava]|nr:UTP--glucose-1-phosphate uridylyltransferase [Psidium guajava]
MEVGGRSRKLLTSSSRARGYANGDGHAYEGKMSPEEAENCRDDMEIDGKEPEKFAQKHVDIMPDGFNANYLQAQHDMLLMSLLVISTSMLMTLLLNTHSRVLMG